MNLALFLKRISTPHARLFLASLSYGAAMACAATVEIRAEEPAQHPLFSHENKAVNGAEKTLKEFSEKEFLELVPRQSPRSGQPCPAGDKTGSRQTHWEWNPHKPNQIRCGSFVYPDPKTPAKTERVEVLSGKFVEVPYLDGPDGRCFIQAEIDNAKRMHLWRTLDQLAAGYAATHDERFARRIAVALDAWANYLPDYFMSTGRDPVKLVSPAEAARMKWAVRRASDHNGLSHEWSSAEVRAFDAIWNSQSLKALSAERGYDVRAHIARDYFANEGDFITKNISVETATATNLSGPFQVLADNALLLGKHDYVEWLNRYMKVTLEENFVRDGMYPESFGYHKGYAKENLEIARSLDRFFKIYPPSTPALLAARDASADRLRRLERSAVAHLAVALPNGDLAPFDDTLFGEAPARETTRSTLLPAYGHLSLGAGAGLQQTQLNLQFNDYCNHVHKSGLGLTLFAFGEEQLGNNRYGHGLAGRGFLNSTMAHNTVTIDRASQERGNIQLTGNRGHLFSGGDLKSYEPGLMGVALAEIDSRRAYPSLPEGRYQRLTVLNTNDPAHPYLLDVFRVGGGHIHDYFLHGSVKSDESSQASFKLQPIAKKFPLLEEGEKWVEPKSESSTDDWYGVFRDMSTGRSPGNWNVTFRDRAHNTGTRIHVSDAGDSQVFLGRSPVAIRQNSEHADSIFNYWRPTLLIRRESAEKQPLQSLFVTVIEPFSGESTITKVERLPLKQADAESTALRITFASGREDICLVDLSTSARSVATVDGKYRLEGRFGIVSREKSRSKGWLIAGREFHYGDAMVQSPSASYAGTLSAVLRRTDGSNTDAFVTDAQLPTGAELKGKWLALQFGTYAVVPSKPGDFPLGIKTQSGITQMFQIDSIERRDGKTLIRLVDDPALKIGDGKTVEQLRPNRTFEGTCHFRIDLSKYAQ